jgi:hypothetical protein
MQHHFKSIRLEGRVGILINKSTFKPSYESQLISKKAHMKIVRGRVIK